MLFCLFVCSHSLCVSVCLSVSGYQQYERSRTNTRIVCAEEMHEENTLINSFSFGWSAVLVNCLCSSTTQTKHTNIHGTYDKTRNSHNIYIYKLLIFFLGRSITQTEFCCCCSLLLCVAPLCSTQQQLELNMQNRSLGSPRWGDERARKAHGVAALTMSSARPAVWSD